VVSQARPWTIIEDPSVGTIAMRLARGVYQRRLIQGEESWSGKGKGPKCGPSYARSRANLLKRMKLAKIHFEFKKVGHRNVLVIGKTAAPTVWERLLNEED
jgi:hypothetical protein